MSIPDIIGLLPLLYGLTCLSISLAKPAAIWRLGKIQGFVQLIGEKGTTALIFGLGVGTAIAGTYLLWL